MREQVSYINSIMEKLQFSKWGLADISEVHRKDTSYPTAISLMMNYPLIETPYNELQFHNVIMSTKDRLNSEVKKLEKLLQKQNIRYKRISDWQDAETLYAEFPHKTAAVNAGMGWIGKNALLITEEYGPRLRLSTILLDIKYEKSNKIIESKCGECKLCINACTYNYLTGESWNKNASRENMLEAHECSRTRESYIKSIGHKHACGHCLLVCPYGK